MMHTILGAGGAIGNELARALARKGVPLRLVSRNPTAVERRAELISADLSDAGATLSAVSGSSVVYLLAGLKYDTKVWRELWPRIMNSTIDACKNAGARLVFFDNVYMYGKVDEPMTEDTPFNPSSAKGEVRARIATTLLEEIRKGNVTALIARSADFYGPRARTGLPNILVFDKLAKGQRAAWLMNDSVPHSFTFTSDAAASLVMLAENEAAWNRTWHVPTAPQPPTGRAFIEMAAQALGVEPRYRVLGRTMIRIAGLFDTTVRELREMLYQYDSPYIFDSTRFCKTFNFEPTPYAQGIARSTPERAPSS